MKFEDRLRRRVHRAEGIGVRVEQFHRWPGDDRQITVDLWQYAYENDLTAITTSAKDFLALLNVEIHPGLIVLRESGLSCQEQWDRVEPVLQHLLKLNAPSFMLNKVIEIEAPGRFYVHEIPSFPAG